MKAQLKNAGVQHADLTCQNVCRDDVGNLKIIDFSHAWRVPMKRKSSKQHSQLHRNLLLSLHKQAQISVRVQEQVQDVVM